MSKMSDFLVRAMTIENTPIVGNCARFLVNLDNSPVRREDILDKGKQTRLTNGYYFIKYAPRNSYKGRQNPPYVFVCDMLRFTLRFRDSKHFEKAASVFPEVEWVIRNTNYTPGIFKWAVLHPGMLFPFSVNWDTYCREISNKAGVFDNNPNYMDQYKPLVTFRCSPDHWDFELKDYEYYNPHEAEYANQLREFKKI